MTVNKRANIKICGFLAAVTFALSAKAVDLAVTLDANDPLASNVGDSWCNPNDRVEVRPFTVSLSGTYEFSNLTTVPSGADVFVQINEVASHLYEPLINADTYGSSPVAAAPSGELVAGTQYYFIAITACFDAAETPVSVTVSLTGDGVIDIDAGDVPAATPIPVWPAGGVALLTTLLALYGKRSFKRRE
jgi:hypothetical protein